MTPKKSSDAKHTWTFPHEIRFRGNDLSIKEVREIDTISAKDVVCKYGIEPRHVSYYKRRCREMIDFFEKLAR